MAESSACLLRSFSQPSSVSEDSQEGDPLHHALSTSVSFGRFMSESLSWEKWSSFTQNRYLEEVEKYAKPGSVAEKKAYFEAHYKRKASQRTAAAAASLDQQNEGVNDIYESGSENGIPSQGQENSYVAIEEEQDEQDPTSDFSLSVDECCTCAQSPEGYNRGNDQFKGLNQETDPPTPVENLVELSALPILGQSPVEEFTAENVEADVINTGKEQQQVFEENQDELHGLPDHCMSPQRTCSVDDEGTEGTKQEKEHLTSVQKQIVDSTQVSALSDKKKPGSASAKLSGCKPGSRLRPPPKPTTPIQRKKSDQASSYHKRTGQESSGKGKSTLKSLHMSINFASHVGNNFKLPSPELQRIPHSRHPRNFDRTTGENTKQQTAIRASTSGVSKHLSAAPCPVIGGTRKAMIHSISGSVIGDKKSESLYMRSSLSSTTWKPKAQHPIVSAFNLRTEERAAKRKEKLQQKLSMEAAEKEHLQARVKEKIRNNAKELRDVKHSVTSQGNANTSFHLGIEPLDVQMKKNTRTQQFPSGIRKKLDSDVLRKPRHPVKADSFKDLLGKNQHHHHLPSNHSTKLFPQKKCVNENASPNIQL